MIFLEKIRSWFISKKEEILGKERLIELTCEEGLFGIIATEFDDPQNIRLERKHIDCFPSIGVEELYAAFEGYVKEWDARSRMTENERRALIKKYCRKFSRMKYYDDLDMFELARHGQRLESIA